MAFNKFFLLFILLSFFKNCYSQDVIELTDANFEQLTQISTGNTTGSWFIKFYAPWCSHCKAISKTWIQLAAELKDQINVARIDVTANSKTRKRFKIEGFPTLIFFKNGKMYDYKNHDRSLEAFKNFALENYKNFKALDPPMPLTFIDVLKDFVFETLSNIDRIYKYAFPSLAVISSVSFLIGLLFGFILLRCCKKTKTISTKTRSSQKKKD
ncbi:thioredoxin-related protein, putative [Plasmodium relictum]|uniref:Thioredoxin-related protein, putative n=1 Tax=Plasmodium relictum TaxID=85471 RepID=A0A1J1HAB5_PLARL|nr:thioredoxin-related protein, putative [Plasmodium relictum]CRH01567.1 thioredoxin-related protein, putative [Plasmodium relictum]